MCVVVGLRVCVRVWVCLSVDVVEGGECVRVCGCEGGGSCVSACVRKSVGIDVTFFFFKHRVSLFPFPCNSGKALRYRYL